MKLSASDKLALIREYKAQGGKGSYLDVIREYQNGGWTNKYIPNTDKFLQPTSEKLPSGFVIPFNTPSTELAISIGGVNGEPAYLIPSFKYGESLKNPMEEYKNTGEHLGGPFKTWQEAEEFEKIRHSYVEKNQPIPSPIKTRSYQNGGKTPKPIELSPVEIYSRNDPAFKAYQDSLTLYKYSSKALKDYDRYASILGMGYDSWLKFSENRGTEEFLSSYDRLEKLNKQPPSMIGIKSFDVWRNGNPLFKGNIALYKKPTNPPDVKPVPKMNSLLNISPSQALLSKREIPSIPKPQNYTDYNFYFGNALAWRNPNMEIGYYNLGDNEGRIPITMKELNEMSPESRKGFLESFGNKYNEQYEEAKKSYQNGGIIEDNNGQNRKISPYTFWRRYRSL